MGLEVTLAFRVCNDEEQQIQSKHHTVYDGGDPDSGRIAAGQVLEMGLEKMLASEHMASRMLLAVRQPR